MSLYKYNITVKVNDEDDKYNEMTIRLGIKNAIVANFGEVVQCNAYVDKKDFYKHSSKRTGYVIPYNFPLNTRRGFRTIYFLMKLSQHDMVTVIKDIIGVRRSAIDETIDKCNNLSNENNYIMSYLLRGGYIG